MIRPGKMRHAITIERVTRAPDAYGAEAETWAALGTIRAELVSEEAATEPSETAGTLGRRKLTFRAWAFSGLTLADRLQWRGLALDLVQIVTPEDGGRLMELTCEGAA